VSDLFKGDTYATPVDRRRPLLARILGGTRLAFYWYAFQTVRGGRAAALAGHFTAAEFARRSEEVVRAVEACGGHIEVSGLDHVGAVAGPVVVVGNHMSFLETFMLPAMILPRKPVSFVVKQSLLSHPALGPILRSMDSIALTRTNPREDLRIILEEGVRRLQSGQSLCIFPQSTRTPDFSIARFNSIGTKLAQRGGCPVIPVALQTDFLGNGVWLKDLGPIRPERPVRFAFGPAIDASEPRQAQQQTVEFIVSRLSAWGVACS